MGLFIVSIIKMYWHKVFPVLSFFCHRNIDVELENTFLWRDNLENISYVDKL